MADDKNDEKVVESGGGGMKKMLIFSVAGLAAIIGAAFLFTTFAVPVAPENGDEAVSEEGDENQDGKSSLEDLIPYELPSIIINVKGTGMKRMLKVALKIAYEASKPDEAILLLEKKQPEIKHCIQMLLIEKTMEELEGRDNRTLLIEEILEELNNVIFTNGGGNVREIFFDEFVIQ